jgi:hypothetical protein
LRSCTRDGECRPGYSCQGDPSGKGCYPAPTGTGGSGGTGTGGTGTGATGGGGGSINDNSALKGCYWRNQDITYRLYFDGVSAFKDISYNPVSGQMTSSGTYQVSGGQVQLNYSSGDPKTYPLAEEGNAVVIVDGSAKYKYAEPECS